VAEQARQRAARARKWQRSSRIVCAPTFVDQEPVELAQR
jgi:hypothetical protein